MDVHSFAFPEEKISESFVITLQSTILQDWKI